MFTLVMHLIYRKFQPGDAAKIARIFNRAFGTSLFLKRAEDCAWKFEQNPDFKPTYLNICEDTDVKKIVGFIASEVELVNHYNQILKMGFINDVGTDPEYQKQGIGKKLMQIAMDLFTEEQTQLSCLIADPKGHPRSRIYCPVGYRDYCHSKACFHVLSVGNIIRDIPLIIILSPFILLYKAIYGLIQTIRKLHDIVQYRVEIKDGEPYPAFYTAVQRVNSVNYDLFPQRSEANWKWRREQEPGPFSHPFYISIWKQDQMIAGVSIIDRVADLHVMKLKAHIGFILDYFVDYSQFSSQKTLLKFMDWFNGVVFRSATRRRISALLHFTSEEDMVLMKSLRRSGVLNVPGGEYMIREDMIQYLKLSIQEFQEKHEDQMQRKKKPLKSNEKPVYISTYDIMGIP